ncbi:hypothetical protein BC941DRAFT_402492 [Chlamydoabsidia padenii]|nr:hypothetical protein BC941DRAFT_402492 [Chlamydoabsidia padenii]
MDPTSKKRKQKAADSTGSFDDIENDRVRKNKSVAVPTSPAVDKSDMLRKTTLDWYDNGNVLDDILGESCLPLLPPQSINTEQDIGYDTPPDLISSPIDFGTPKWSPDLPFDEMETNSMLDTTWDDDEDDEDTRGTQTQALQTIDTLQPWTSVLESGLRRFNSHTIETTIPRKRRMPLEMDVLTRGDSLQLWWFDAYQHYRKGTIYLFGKIFDRTVKRYTSCSVIIKNVKRTIYVLPRPYHLNKDGNPGTTRVTMDDVKQEITLLLERHNIYDYTCTIRSRKYAFGLDDIPPEADYLKIQYSFEDPELPGDVNGYTYSHIFGTNNAPMEQFLIKRGIKGPQWLEIKDTHFVFGSSQETWCQYEFIVFSPKKVTLLKQDQPKTPPISVMSLHLTTSPHPQTSSNEIIAAAILFCPEVMLDQFEELESLKNSRITVVRPWGGNTSWPVEINEAVQREKLRGLPIRIEDSEYGLLNYLCAKIHLFDPDVIVSHGFSRSTLGTLLHRMKTCDTSYWHKIGRLRWKSMPKLLPGTTSREKALLAGRLVCDTMVGLKSLILTKSYNLSSLAETQLGIQSDDEPPSMKLEHYSFDKATILVAQQCWMDAYLAMILLFKFQILQLSKKLTTIAGNLWSRSLDGSRMNRNEYLLLHEFHQLKFICPDSNHSDISQGGIELEGLEEEEALMDKLYSEWGKTKQSKKQGPSYGGGLLLEPKIGLHEQFVVLLDFNSLYPSIIQEFNICFTTVDTKKVGEGNLLPDIPGPDIPLGVLPRLMERFVNERKQVKQLMKTPGLDENKKMQYDIEQNALKLTANSIYGSLGSGFSRFSARHLAAMITSQGRTILRDTVDAVEQELDLDIVYGDTDSIMVATTESTMQAAQRIANQVQGVINSKYRLLELGIDGYFRRLLILGKKNYASLVMVNNNYIIKPKGSVIIRKDVSELCFFTTMRILKVILSDESNKQEAVQIVLKRINQQVRAGNVPITKFLIHKHLTKDLDSYTKVKGQVHVQVALKMQQAGHVIKGGDTVAYIICLADDEMNASTADKAISLFEAETGQKTLDYDWYFEHEILPSVTRLCEPIMDTSELALCCGLNPPPPTESKRQGRRQTNKKQDASFKKMERTTGLDALKVKCSHCHGRNKIQGYAKYHPTMGCWVSGLQCTHCQHIMTGLSSQLVLAIRAHIGLYYQGWLICQDVDCDYKIRDCSLQCQTCHGTLVKEYTAEMLYSQLLYFDGLFDTDNQDPAKLAIVKQHDDTFQSLRRIIKKYLDQCSYRFIDMNDYIMGYDDVK